MKDSSIKLPNAAAHSNYTVGSYEYDTSLERLVLFPSCIRTWEINVHSVCTPSMQFYNIAVYCKCHTHLTHDSRIACVHSWKEDKTVVPKIHFCLLPYVMQGGRHDQRCYNRLLIIYFQATFHVIGILRPLLLAFALVTFTQTLHFF